LPTPVGWTIGDARMRVLISPGADRMQNPYVRLLYGEMAKHCDEVAHFSSKALLFHRPDVVHVNWPEYLVRWRSLRLTLFDIVKIIGLFWLARRRGTAVVWTGHNLEPHDVVRPLLWRAYFRLFRTQTDLLLSLGDGATQLLTRRYPSLARTPVVVVPHGHYRDVYPSRPDTQVARRSLGVDGYRPVLLVFGQIRTYKNVPKLVKAWARLAVPRPQLLVAGEPGRPELEAAIRSEAAGHPDAHLLLRFVEDDEVPAFFAAADVVVAPYLKRSTLNSGVAILALSFGRPTVLTDTPANRDLQRLVGAEWVYLCDGTPRDAFRVALEAAATPRFGSPDLAALDWKEVGVRTSDAYALAMSIRRSAGDRIGARRGVQDTFV
jgi:beta-1,4-mannosyltransferase